MNAPYKEKIAVNRIVTLTVVLESVRRPK
jgi:hypothetical protein